MLDDTLPYEPNPDLVRRITTNSSQLDTVLSIVYIWTDGKRLSWTDCSAFAICSGRGTQLVVTCFHTLAEANHQIAFLFIAELFLIRLLNRHFMHISNVEPILLNLIKVAL